MIRIGRDQSIPVYVETIPLKPTSRVVGLLLGVLLLVGGFAEAIWADGTSGRVAGPLLVMAGGILVIAVVRCRAYEITVGTARTEAGTGPFRETIPTGSIESTELRPASGWRRLYADEEVLLHLDTGSGEAVVPSRDPAALHSAISEPQ
jgi:hypothetical protein